MDQQKLSWISDAEWSYLTAYILHLMPMLGLSDWTIVLAEEALPKEDDAWGKLWMVEGRRRARMQLHCDWKLRSGKDKANTLIHELVHCHQSSVLDIVRLDLVKQLSQSTYDVFFEGFRRQVEFMTDAYTEAFAPLLPPYDFKEAGATS